MTPVVQRDRTGCALASVAALTRQSYAAVKREAASLGIAVTDPRLWGGTAYIRRLLRHFRVPAGAQKNFTSWEALPDCALLAIKWHRERNGPAWHWVVFVREASDACVLDPKQGLRSNRRTDFGRIKPKWFIRVRPNPAA